jgi:uncharacterized membrane protein
MSEIPPPTVPPATPPPPGGGSYTPPPPPPPGSTGGAAPGTDRTLMLVLSYLWILALIPYLTTKDDPEVLWHAKNGLGLLILDIVTSVLFWVLGFVLGDFLGCLSGTMSCVVWMALLALHIYCLIHAVGGKRPNIPVVTDFAQKTL